MNLILLRFCYGVEIGAYLAYVGHYKASKDPFVKSISRDELKHMILIKRVLSFYNARPSVVFNVLFLFIGHIIRILCAVTPMIVLDGVAQIMEVFNIISYSYMAKAFPEFKGTFLEMQQNESDHELYFSTFPKLGRK